MSAISAVWQRSGFVDVERLHTPVNAAIVAYGKDRSARWCDKSISLGINRFDHLPESRFDGPSLWSEDRSVCLVADIRLDNRSELATELNLAHSHQLSDSSILMAAWLRWGEACLHRMVGGYAFIVWIPRSRELFAARDHVGERPLFYHVNGDLVAVASMPKGLLALPGISRAFEESCIADWMALLSPAPQTTFFKSIKKIPPGHFLRVSPNSCECVRYWHPCDAKPIRFKKNADYAEAMLEIFDQAVKARLRSNRGIASELSAGYDSSSVTASAAVQLGRMGRRLTSFTAVPRPEFDQIAAPKLLPDEGPGAAEVARMYPNIDHVLVDSRGYDLLETLRTWSDALGQPAFNVVNFLWIAAILDQARQADLDVLLCGVAGNATISWGSFTPLKRLFRKARLVELIASSYALRRNRWIGIKRATAYALTGILPSAVDTRWRTRKTAALANVTVNPALIAKYDLAGRVPRLYRDVFSSLEAERRWQFDRLDLGQMNAATNAVTGVDYRDPMSDKRVWEFCYGIPPEQYLVEGHWRSLLRRSMKDRLPLSTLDRRDTGQQAADWNIVMEEALPSLRAEMTLLERSPNAARALDLGKMRGLLNTWPTNGFQEDAVELDYHLGLSRGISMGDFLMQMEQG